MRTVFFKNRELLQSSLGSYPNTDCNRQSLHEFSGRVASVLNHWLITSLGPGILHICLFYVWQAIPVFDKPVFFAISFFSLRSITNNQNYMIHCCVAAFSVMKNTWEIKWKLVWDAHDTWGKHFPRSLKWYKVQSDLTVGWIVTKITNTYRISQKTQEIQMSINLLKNIYLCAYKMTSWNLMFLLLQFHAKLNSQFINCLIRDVLLQFDFRYSVSLYV